MSCEETGLLKPGQVISEFNLYMFVCVESFCHLHTGLISPGDL